MKTYKLIFSFATLILLSSCKKEVSEKEAVKQISGDVVKKNLSNEDFNKTIFPLVKELYEKDSVKYKMINHIANKAKAQKDPKIFIKNVENLKAELKYIQ